MNRCRRADTITESLDQGALADPGFTPQQHDLPARRRHLIKQPDKQTEFGIALQEHRADANRAAAKRPGVARSSGATPGGPRHVVRRRLAGELLHWPHADALRSWFW